MCKSFTSLCVFFCDEIVNRNGIRNSSLDLALASCRRITQDSCRLRRNTAETEMIPYTDISSTDDRHAADSRPLGSDRYVDRVITASIDRHSMECLRKVGFYSPTTDRLSTDMSTECRSTGRSSVNHTRSICRSSVDRWWSIASGALLWNSLPENIRAIRSIGQFKKEINRALETFDSHSAIM